MTDGAGFIDWTDLPTLQVRGAHLSIDGHEILGSLREPQFVEPGVGTLVPTLAKTHVLQVQLPLPKQPLTMGACAFDFSILLRWEEDAIRLRRAARRGVAVRAFLNRWIEDEWLIRGKAVGQTEWRMSRRHSWGLPAITHVTHPPRVCVDGVAKTVVTTTPANVNEIQVPTTQPDGVEYGTIITHADLTGTYLTVLYWPEMSLLFEGMTDAFPTANGWFFEAGAQEMLRGRY